MIRPFNSKICSVSLVNIDLVSVLFSNGFGSDRGRNSAIRWRCSEGSFTGSRRIGFLRYPRESMVRFLTIFFFPSRFRVVFHFMQLPPNAKLLKNVNSWRHLFTCVVRRLLIFSSFMQAQFSMIMANWDNAVINP